MPSGGRPKGGESLCKFSSATTTSTKRAESPSRRKCCAKGIFREMKGRRYYEKPSEQAVREKGEAVRRARKMARKKAVCDGLN